jgi:predicted nucleic acid-binding protein
LREFFDTSILVASFWGGHVNHSASIRSFAAADKKHSACGIHSLAEMYGVMSSLPVTPVIPPEQVILFVEEVRNRLTLISLDENEYFQAIRNCAECGFNSGRVYDALLLACAAKSDVTSILTWNVKHFQRIAPQLAGKIRTP